MTDEQIAALRKASAVLCGTGYHDEASTINALLAAGASEGQEPVAYLRKDEYGNSDTVDSHIYGAFPVYAHPSAEIAALRERIADLEAVEKMRDEEIAGLREKHGNALERIAGMEKEAREKSDG